MTDINPRSIFRLSVSFVGVYSIYTGLLDLMASLLLLLDLGDQIPGVVGTDRYWAVRGAMEIGIGLIFLSGWFPLEQVAFGKSGTSKEDEEE